MPKSPAEKKPLPEIPESSWGSKLYWLTRNIVGAIKRFALRHKLKFLLILLILVVLAYLFRAWLQPFAITTRLYFAPILIALLGLLAGSAVWAKKKYLEGAIVMILSLVFGILAFSPHTGIRHYLALYYHYKSHPHRQLEELPLTKYERIHPRNAVQTLAREGISDVQEVSAPEFVRVGDDYVWSMAIEPAFAVRKLTGKVEEVISVPADKVALNFSGENRYEVEFFSSEGMFAARNTRTAVINGLNPWRFMNYEPVQVRYIRNDDDEWVQMVSLVRWKGFFLPRPVFGGVVIIDQGAGVDRVFKSMVMGAGEWIPPGEIGKHEFLTNQNVLPEKVSRFTAQSYRFSQGFLSPMPGYHRGDIRIPDLPGDFNDQPFTGYFETGESASLYHYFALEPFQEDKQGLNTSLLVPADGQGDSLVYRHYEKEQVLTGVSAIVSKVMESRKNYDWSRNSAAEQRPFIRDIAGERRFFWLTTVVTHIDEDKGGDFIVGAAPDITLTDAAYKTVVWVDSRKPDEWESQLHEELKSVWETEEVDEESGAESADVKPEDGSEEEQPSDFTPVQQ
ncbi:MAG: hypothetical protein CMO55_26460 [Verrucomicrobiales bacterium]|nr:hypothetical protein [Verrucomicrobiales bacterium]